MKHRHVTERREEVMKMNADVNLKSSVTAAYKCGSVLIIVDKNGGIEEPMSVINEKIRYARTIAKRIC